MSRLLVSPWAWRGCPSGPPPTPWRPPRATGYPLADPLGNPLAYPLADLLAAGREPWLSGSPRNALLRGANPGSRAQKPRATPRVGLWSKASGARPAGLDAPCRPSTKTVEGRPVAGRPAVVSASLRAARASALHDTRPDPRRSAAARRAATNPVAARLPAGVVAHG